MSNMRQLGAAMVLYTQDNKSYLPRPASGALGPQHDDYIHWQLRPAARDINKSALAPFIRLQNEPLRKIFRCPLDTEAGTRKQVDSGRDGSYGGFQYSYSMNDYFLPSENTAAGPRKKFTSVKRSSEKMLLGEERDPYINDGRWVVGAADDQVSTRHSGKGNILFCDTHVEKLTHREANNKILADPFN
jgi:prepilin-type processing-associated H-X9-DG protein